MWLRLLSLCMAWFALSQCPNILVNPWFNSSRVSSGALTGWKSGATTLQACRDFTTGKGGMVKVSGYYGDQPRMFQNVSTIPSQSYTFSCDLYDYDYGFLDAVDGQNPLTTSLPGATLRLIRKGFYNPAINFSAQSTTTTVTVFSIKACVRSCSLVPQTCGTNAPTPGPIFAPVIVTLVSNDALTVNVTSINSGIFSTRCVAHQGAGYTNITSLWTIITSAVNFVAESASSPFIYTFSGLQSNTAYAIDCACKNGRFSNITTRVQTTLPKCSDNVVCPPTSRCVDTSDGSRAMCSPYFDGVKLTSSSQPCRRFGGSLSTDLTTTAGGDNLTVCLAVGNNTNSDEFTSSIQFFYGVTTLMPCLNASFSSVSNGYLTATCLTSPGVGRALNFSLLFNPPNALAAVSVPAADYVGYPFPTIIANTSRFANVLGSGFTSALRSSSTEAVLIAFSVTNIAPSSPLLRVFYGPDSNPRQLECTIDRVRTNYSTIVCTTDPTTTYSSSPYKWTVVTGEASVRGTDTFNLAENSPRITSANATVCVSEGGRVRNCPTTTTTPVVLTVYGFNFFDANQTIRVSVDGSLCGFIAAVFGENSTMLDRVTCYLPAGTGFNRNVFIQVGAKFSAPLPLVSYNAPSIDRLCGCDTSCLMSALEVVNCDRAGGNRLDIYGSSFGTQGASVLVGSNTCDQVEHDSFSPDTHISCTLRAGYSIHSSVVVIQQNGPNSAGGEPAQVSFAMCEPGTIQDGGLTVCRHCEAGSYAPLAGQLECLLCAPGSYANDTKKTACSSCTLGTYQDEYSGTECKACDAGTFSGSTGLSSCVECQAGMYINTTGASECMTCQLGNYVSIPRATACWQCTPGHYATVTGQSTCSVCLPGSYSNSSGATLCVACARGHYMTVAGQSSCRPCDVGKYADSVASLQCTVCAPGSFSDGLAATSCQACAKGSYQDATGANLCSECAPGKAVDTIGATECAPCETGMIAENKGMAKCTKCPDFSFQESLPPICVCNISYYMAHNRTCVRCVMGSECTRHGIEESGLVASWGYVRIANLSLFHACLDATYCPGGHTRCAPFRTGPLCNICEEGYRPVEGAPECSLCPQEGTSALYIVIIAFLLLLGLTLLYAFMLRTDMYLFATMEVKRRQQWWHENAKEDPIDGGLRLSTSVEDLEVEPDESPIVDMKAEKRIKKTLSYQFKIFITFLQLLTALLSLSDVNWPPSFQYFVGGFEFINLNFLPWNYVGCLAKFRLFDKIMLTAFFPPLFLVIIGGPLMGILWCLERRDQSDRDDARLKRAQAKTIFWRIIVFTLFLCYPAVSRQIITYFRCIEVPDGTTSSTYYLLASFWEQCYDDQWYSLLAPVVFALLAYPVGVPLGLLWALIHFKPWFRDSRILYSLGLAYSGFHPEFWWFELLDMLHKLTLTCLVALFANSKTQVIAALVISASYVLVLLLAMPYIRLHDNLLHLLSQVEVFLLVLAMQCGGDVSNVGSGSVTDVLVSGMLILIVIAVITAFLILIVRFLRLLYLRKMQRKKQFMTEKNSPQLGSATMSFDPGEEIEGSIRAQAVLVRSPSRGVPGARQGSAPDTGTPFVL